MKWKPNWSKRRAYFWRTEIEEVEVLEKEKEGSIKKEHMKQNGKSDEKEEK